MGWVDGWGFIEYSILYRVKDSRGMGGQMGGLLPTKKIILLSNKLKILF